MCGTASKFDSDEALARALQQEEAGGRTTRASRAASPRRPGRWHRHALQVSLPEPYSGMIVNNRADAVRPL